MWKPRTEQIAHKDAAASHPNIPNGDDSRRESSQRYSTPCRKSSDGRLGFRQSHSFVAKIVPSGSLLLLHFGLDQLKLGVQSIMLALQVVVGFTSALHFCGILVSAFLGLSTLRAVV